jgi:hypothetical protein
VLTAYQTATQNLLQNPGAPVTLYPTATLTTFINTARGQLAGDGECIRNLVTFATVSGHSNYGFTSAVISVTGIQGILNIRALSSSAQQAAPLNAWPWEYFQQYFLFNGLTGLPTDWAQYSQGANGSFYVNPIPINILTLTADAVCYPINLVDDTTVEAIPYPWTDAVPYFAAYLALMGAQTSARIEYAQRMLQLYNEFKDRARRYSTPEVLPFQYEQTGMMSVKPQTQPASRGG